LVFARLRIQEPGAGYVHFSDTLNDEYFRQLTAEKIIVKYVRGFKRRVFTKIRPRNESLDCFVYGLAAYSIINTNVNSISAKIEAKSVKIDPVETIEQTPAPAKRRVARRNTQNYMNAWR
jgi:phage terminase large subunit GpA-like protein